MRGRDDRADGLFSYVRLEERIPADHPLRAVRRLADEALAALNGRFEGLYSSMGRPSIPPEMLLRATLLQAFFSVRSERMLDGTDRLQSIVPLVRRPADGCGGLAPDGVHPQPRPVARGGRGTRVPGGIVGSAAGQGASVERTLLRRRHTDRSLGLDEELPAERRLGGAARTGAQWRSQLPQGEALERDARLDHRSRCPALSQVGW